jgi:F420-dependent oxidoreductase-like protein
MKFGLQINNFTWPGGAGAIGPTLARVTRAADDAGFDSIWVMDHFFQIRGLGPPEAPMLDGMTALGFMAAHSDKARIGLMVGGIHYRQPGLWVKAHTTLDVLTGGRAWFGIGAAWNEEESQGLGLPFPATAERFERLEEALQICLQMWSDDESAYDGKHYQLGRTLNQPQSIRQPHPPILIGGGGEKKTLRLVAQYAQACNLFASPELEHKLDVLRGHCEDVGRDYDDIEKTVMAPLDPGADGEKVDTLLEELHRLHDLGVSEVHGRFPEMSDLKRLEILGDKVIPVAAAF